MIRKIVFLLIAVVLFNSCSLKNRVYVVETNCKGEVATNAKLYWKFSHSLIPDSLLNRWDSVEYVHINPTTIKGRFRWEKQDYLVYYPYLQFDSNSNFNATISNKILLHSSLQMLPVEPVKFYTK